MGQAWLALEKVDKGAVAAAVGYEEGDKIVDDVRFVGVADEGEGR